MIVILVLRWHTTAHGVSISLVWVHLRVGQLTEEQRLRGCIQVIRVHAGGVRTEAVHGIHDL